MQSATACMSPECLDQDPYCNPAAWLPWALSVNSGLIPTNGRVASFQKISDTRGGFNGMLDDGDMFSTSVASPGDLNGDLIPDLVVGASDDGDGGSNRGAVYVLFLNANGTVLSEQKISDLQGGFNGVLDDSDSFGISAGSPGDLNGDLIPDVVAGAHRDGDGGIERGAVYVLFLNANGTVQSFQKISDTAGGFNAILDDGDESGTSVVSPGDLNGDLIPDLVIGARLDDDGGPDRGAVYVLFLNANGTVLAEQKISDTQGGFNGVLDDSDRFGSSVGAPGDLNGDGIPDLVVGAPNDGDGGLARGAVYVLFLNANGTVQSEQKISDTQGGFNGILDDGDEFGISVASSGDLNGDFVPDLVVGAPNDGDGGVARGAVYVLFLNANGTVQSEQKISDTQGGFNGILDDDDVFGFSVAAPGDVNGDFVPDLVVGASNDGDGGSERGAVYVLFLEAAQ